MTIVGDVIAAPDGSEFEIVAMEIVSHMDAVRLVLKPKDGLIMASISLIKIGEEARPLRATATENVNWFVLGMIPLACEVRVGDVLHPSKVRGRRSNSDSATRPPSPQIVTRISQVPPREVQIETNDSWAVKRIWRREPLDMLGPNMPKRRGAPRPDELDKLEYEGPYSNNCGAQFIFQQRPPRRPRNSDPQYDEKLEPWLDSETGQLLPYVVFKPKTTPPKHTYDRDWRAPQYNIGHVSQFTARARELVPAVNLIIAEYERKRHDGMVPIPVAPIDHYEYDAEQEALHAQPAP